MPEPILCIACNDPVRANEAAEYDGHHEDCFKEAHCSGCEEETDVDELLEYDGLCKDCAGA